MDKTQIQVLLIEDNPVDVVFLREALGQDALNSFDLTAVERLHTAIEALQNNSFDIILLDLGLPDAQGLGIFTRIHRLLPEIPKIILSGLTDEALALQAVQVGAQDYIMKGTAGFSAAARAIRYAIERNKGQQQLRASEERFRYLFDNNPHPMWAYDLKTLEFLAVNDAAVGKYGYTREEFLRMTIADIRPKEDVERLQKHLEIPRPSLQHSGEWRHKLKDGTLIDVDISSHTLKLSGRESALVVAQDITERRRAEGAVRASEERFRAMIENGLDDISLLDIHGNLLWESPAVVRNLGYPENAFVGQNIFNIVHPEDKAWTNTLYTRLIEVPGSRQEGKFRLQRSDGTWRWVEAIVTNMLDNPSVQAIVVNYRDITERKQAEENYQAIFERAVEGVFQSSPEGRYINVNPAMARIYGYASPQEMIESIHDIAQQIYLEPQDRTEFTRLFNIDGSVNNFEMKNKRKDGSIIWTSTTARTVRSTDGKLLYYEGFLQDITERKQAEEALHASEERYRGIFDGVQDAIFVESLKGEILDVNQRACEIFGYSHAEFITKQVIDIVPSEEHLIRLWDDEDISLEHSYETINVRANGEQFPVEIRGGFYEFGDHKLFLVVLRDITERKQAEATIRSLAKFPEENPNPILRIGKDGQIIYANTASHKWLTGWGASLNDPLPEEWLVLVADAYQRDTKQTLDIAIRDHVYAILIVPFPGEGYTNVYGQDVTENKRTEDKLRYQANLLANINDAIVAVDDQYRITNWNHAAEVIYGWSAEEVLGRNGMDIIRTNFSAEQLQTQMRTLIATGELHIESGNYRKDNELIWVDTRSSLLRRADGTFEGLVSVNRDITERKQIEDALKETSEQFRTLFEASPEAIMIVDPHDDWPILDCNTTGCAMNGYARAELIGQSVDIFNLTPGNPTERAEYLEKVRTAGVLRYETSHRRKDGTVFPVEVSTSIITLGGREVVLGIDRDITERKEAEDRVRKSEARLAEAQIMAKVGSWETDLATLKVMWSDETYRIFELDTNTFHESHPAFLDFVHPEDRKKVDEAFTSSLEKDLYNSIEHRIITSKGNLKFVEERWRVEHDTQGRPVRAVGTCQDITERKRADAALLESEALYRQAIEVAGAVPYRESYSDNGNSIKYEFIGEGIRQITGYGPDEFNAQIWDSLVEEVNLVEDLAGYSLDEGIQRVRSGENYIWKCEHRIRDRAGKIHWVFEAAVELRDENGVSHGSIGTYQDITVRKQAESELRASEHRYMALFEDMPVAIWEDDFSDVKKYLDSLTEQGVTDLRAYFEVHPEAVFHCRSIVKILDVNKAALEMYQAKSKAELIQSTLHDMGEAEKEHWINDLVAFASGKTNGGWESSDETMNDTPIKISSSWTVVPGYEHDLSRIIFTTIDITERKQAEEKLRESEARFASIFHTSPIRVCITRFEDGCFLDVNETFLKSSGYTREEVIGHTSLELNDWMNPQERIRLRTLLKEQGRIQNFETQLRQKSGNILDTLISAELVELFGQSCILSVGIDITERKQAEEALRQSENRYRTVVENQSEFIVRWKSNGVRTFVNEAYCRYYGLSAEEAVSTDFLSLIHADDRLAVQEKISRLLSGKINVETDIHRVIKPDGNIGWQEWTDQAIHDKFAQIIEFQSVGRDITERKQAEEKLRESEARFASIFHTNPTRVSITSFEDGRFLDVNEAFLASTGLNREEVIGRTSFEFDDWVNPQERTRLRTLLAEQGSVQNFETQLRRKSGEILDILISAELVDLFGQRCILSVGLDITDRKRDEQKLLEANERFHQLSDNIEEVFWITNAINGEEIYISPAAEKIWGRSVEKLMQAPRAFIEHILPDDHATVLRALEEQKNGQRTEIEYRIVQPDESVRWVWDRAFPIFDEAGKVIRLAGIAADVTERKQAEEALRESEERFRSLFDRMLDGVYRSSHSGKFLDVNPAMVRMFGYSSREEMLNVDIKNELYFAPDERGSHILDTGREETDIYRMRRKDGSEIWVEDHGSYVHDKDGEIRYHEGILRDITERKQAEEALLKNEQRLRIALASTNIAVFNQDLDLRYTWMYQPQLGYTSEQVVGKTDTELLPAQDAPGIIKIKSRVIETGGAERAEITVHSADQTTYYDLIVEPLLDNIGMIIGITGSTLDITEHKKAEIETHRHLAELEALYENGLAVGRLLNLNEIGERIIATFARHLSWHHVAIRLIEPERNEMRLVAFNQEGLSAGELDAAELLLNSTISKVGQGLSGWVVQTGQALRTGNVHDRPQYVTTYPNIQSGLYMPLKVGDTVIGVISVESDEPNAFTEQDERLLATLANQTAIAFENARLYQSIQQELQERKRAETALRMSETHYRELADSITDIFFELDQNLCYTHWNKASEKLTGIPEAAAIGKSMYEILGMSQEQVRTEKIYESVLLSQHPTTFETHLDFNNQIRAFEVNAYPSTRGVSVVAKDITERNRSETIMQKRFELMEFAAQHSLEEIMQMTIDEVINLTGSNVGFFHTIDVDQASPGLQVWSTNTLKVFNVAVSDGQHRPVEQAGVWADAIRQRRAIIHNDYASLPNKKSLPTGHAPLIREMVIPIIRNEKILAVMGIANKPHDYTQQDLEVAERFVDYAWDITERKRMEVILAEERNQLAFRVQERTADLSRANANLARALRVKDEFLANMSHELRTPLNAILGLSESLAEQTAGPLNEKQHRYITTVSESGHHLLSLINDILDLAKIEAGQIELDVNKVDIRPVCDASLRMIKQLAQKKKQEIVLEVDGSLGLMWADERRLKQMLVNLLSNAVKFTPEGGKLGLEVHGDQDANKVTFTVWDTGIGIKETDLPRLFQPFVQLDAGLARESSGTGLGLALVAQMARMHGGSASVVSEPGKGSRFSIMLPWEPALAVDTVERLKITGKFKAVKFNRDQKPTILLIEDTEEVIMMLSDYLELNGFTTITARDGIEGITQAQLTHPDLILMDIQMPRMDGFETTKKLRSEPEFKTTPIIALTALAMPNDRERCLAAGMDEYITKPVHLRALVKIIELFLSGETEVKNS